MIRSQSKTPAYNCGPRGQNCAHEKKGDHGIHNEVWRYVVQSADGRAALSLAVGSGIYTEDTPTSRFTGEIRGTDMTLHVAFPTDRYDVRGEGPKPGSCPDVLGTAGTHPWSGALVADEFVEAHFDKAAGYNQPESFWAALEGKFGEVLARYPDVSSQWVRCAHCGGEGTVPR